MCYSGFYLFILSGDEGKWKKFKVKPQRDFKIKACNPSDRPKKKKKKGQVGGERPCCRCDPTGEGRLPILYLLLSLYSHDRLFIQRCNVWHFLGGGVPAIVCLGTQWEPTCQRLPAPFSRSVLFIADKHSLVSSSRDGGGGGGDALVIRVRSRRRID